MTRAHHRPRRPTAGRDRRHHSSDPRARRFGLAAAAVHALHGPAATSTNQPTSAPITNPTDWVRKRGRSIKDSETPQWRGERVVRIEDGEPGLAARTIARRLSSVAGLFAYLVARGDAGVASNPVPRGLAGRRSGRRGRGGRLVRTPRTLPRVLSPGDVDALLGALRTRRDRAMVLAMLLGGLRAMLLGGLRRCEVLGLRLDVSAGEQRLFIACGKGGRERIVPVSTRFFEALGEYLEVERPAEAVTEACFVVLKGPRRGGPLSPAGLDEVLDGARGRAGLSRLTCSQLRHTCLTRLREQGMALEALRAQAGHASIESTRIYLHLANDWLAGEYLAAAAAIEAQIDPLAGELAS